MRGALSGLTVRGRSFLAAGLAAAGCAALLGQRDLLRVAVLLLGLPLVSVLAVARTRYRLVSARRVDPVRVPVGQRASVTLRLENVSRVPTGLLLVEDQVPYVLGTRPRFVLDRVSSQAVRTVRYPVRSDLRGRYQLGPLGIRLTDPFGMCELTRFFTARDFLVVTPVIQPLPGVRLGGEWSGNGDSQARSIASAGEDDVTAREYRHGDDLRRVHWRSTARRGELMVRREEQPWQSRSTILLDTRAVAHHGEGPGASLEWAVSAAASIGVHLTRGGHAVRLLTDSGTAVSSAAHDPASGNGDFEGMLLDSLAVVTLSSGRSLAPATQAFRRGGGDGLLVAVLGSIGTGDAEELARLSHSTATAIAFVLDTSTWGLRPGRRPAAGPTAGASRDGDDAARLLRGNGWKVVEVHAQDSLPLMWPKAARVPSRSLSDAPPEAPAGTPAAGPAVPPVGGAPVVGGGAEAPQSRS
jgi:uncharacterized protein (DUF58 family)